MNFADATQHYETWLASVLPAPLVPSDLEHKHRLLADANDPFPFFRGTYYRWAQHWEKSDLADAPRVLAVGDLHVANFGTWRDAEGRLCWGVNDFDEADELPYTNDLVRLAASVRFAKNAGAIQIKLRDACDAILDGYRQAFAVGGLPFVLEEHHPHLRALAMRSDRDPVVFWGKMSRLLVDPPVEVPAEARSLLEGGLPVSGLSPQFRGRAQAGVGSLGRPRFVALASWKGGWLCREAKASAPPATAWLRGDATASRAEETLTRAIRSPDPFYRPFGRWILRRLGPRSSRIELEQLRFADLRRVLRAMASETANVHLGTPGAPEAIPADLNRRPKGWLLESARRLVAELEEDWRGWCDAFSTKQRQ
ncbi:MAG: DUF2252 family protein [Gemmataceae bacterium]